VHTDACVLALTAIVLPSLEAFPNLDMERLVAWPTDAVDAIALVLLLGKEVVMVCENGVVVTELTPLLLLHISTSVHSSSSAVLN